MLGAAGAVPAAPLTAAGPEQARAAGRELTGITRAYPSATVRARQTAEQLAPLPHAVPFVLRRDGTRWHSPRWAG